MNSRLRFAAAAFVALMAGATVAAALDLDDIIRLKLADVDEETIVQVVEQDGTVFLLTVDDIIDLKDAGASEWLIRRLMATSDPSVLEDGYDDEDEYDDEDRADLYGESDDYARYDDYAAGGYDDYYSGYRQADYLDPYDYATVFVYKYYDPFAYYWYPFPRHYIYYSPFWWSHTGFYFAGHYSWDWWDPWGPCTWFWDTHYGWDHHFGPSHTRTRAGRSWHSIDWDAIHARAQRERTALAREGLSTPRARVTDRAVERTRLLLADRERVRGSSPDRSGRTRISEGERVRTSSRASTGDRPRYREPGRAVTRERAGRSSGSTPRVERGTRSRPADAGRGRTTGRRTTEPRSRDDETARPQYRERTTSRSEGSSRAPSVSRGSSRPASPSRSSAGRSSSAPSSRGSSSRGSSTPESSRRR